MPIRLSALNRRAIPLQTYWPTPIFCISQYPHSNIRLIMERLDKEISVEGTKALMATFMDRDQEDRGMVSEYDFRYCSSWRGKRKEILEFKYSLNLLNYAIFNSRKLEYHIYYRDIIRSAAGFSLSEHQLTTLTRHFRLPMDTQGKRQVPRHVLFSLLQAELKRGHFTAFAELVKTLQVR